MNKTQKVKEYLEEHGKITSWEAIQKFRATRLSAIIYNLRNVYEMNIQTVMKLSEEKTPYAEYVLVKEVQ